MFSGLSSGNLLISRRFRPVCIPLLRQPAGSPERRTLEAALKRRPLFAHRLKQHKHRDQNLWAVVRGRWKLIDNEGRLELYDTVADPDDRQNLAEAQPELVRELQAELVAFRDAASWGEGERTAVEVDEASIEALRELGYVD